MSEYTEDKKYTFEIEPTGAIATKTTTTVFKDGEFFSKNVHRCVTDPDNPEISDKLGEVLNTTTLTQQKTITAYAQDIADFKHQADGLTEDILVKDKLINDLENCINAKTELLDKMTLLLQEKDARIEDLETEI